MLPILKRGLGRRLPRGEGFSLEGVTSGYVEGGDGAVEDAIRQVFYLDLDLLDRRGGVLGTDAPPAAD